MITAPRTQDCLRVQFRVKTLGPPAGQSVPVHLGQQHATLRLRTLAEPAQLSPIHFSLHFNSDIRRPPLLNTECECEMRDAGIVKISILARSQRLRGRRERTRDYFLLFLYAASSKCAARSVFIDYI